MTEYSVFVVDDEKSLARGIALNLEKKYRSECFFTAETAISRIAKQQPDVVLLDIYLPGMNGVEALKILKKNHPELIVIMITAYEEINTVIDAMKNGADDYILKPVQQDVLEKAIEKSLKSIRLKKEIKTLQEKYLRENHPLFIGKSKEIQQVMQTVENVAKSPDTPVLILGESGTGKELVAGAIHYRSPNFMGEMVSINCAAIPDHLFESELFGYEPGAFTGARKSGKKGLVEYAKGGTLFLDEVCDMSLDFQAKFLRFLESGEFFRVGGTKKIQILPRIISATNKDINEEIHTGRFREDLFFRIGVIQIKIPSLNRRSEDILLLANAFLVDYADKFGKSIHRISSGAQKALKEYHWKGNVRELKNVIERAVLVSKSSELQISDLGIERPEDSTVQKEGNFFIPEEGIFLPLVLEKTEKGYLKEALQKAEGNEKIASQLLGLKYSTFRYRKKKLLED